LEPGKRIQEMKRFSEECQKLQFAV